MNYETLKIERKDTFNVVSIDRPGKLNALSTKVFEELMDYLLSLEKEITLGVSGLLLTSTSDRAFVAGADIQEMQRMSPAEGEAFSAIAQQVTSTLETLAIPVIACVDGYALGGGCELAMSCDFIYATDRAIFGQPEVNLGLIPGFGGCVRLMRLVGPGRAKEMIYTGRLVSAQEAERIGLINRKFETKEQMMQEAEATLTLISRKSQNAVGLSKRVLNAQPGQTTQGGLDIERAAFREAFAHPHKEIGISAFLQKRSAEFSRRLVEQATAQ